MKHLTAMCLAALIAVASLPSHAVAQDGTGQVIVFVDRHHPSASDLHPGTATQPVRTVSRGVQLADEANAQGRAAHLLIAAGIYRESVVLSNTQKTDAPMLVEGLGAVLSGADVWGGWVAQPDGSFLRPWPHKWGVSPVPNGWGGYWNWDGNGHKRDVLRRSEMIFANGRPLRGVLSLGELNPGAFFVDESNARVHIRLPTGQSMATTTIEVAIRPQVLLINGRRNLTVRGVAVERARGALRDTAVSITNSRNVALEDFFVRWHASRGLASASNNGLYIRRSSFSDNGIMGLGGYRDRNVILEDSEIARNNWRGWAAEHKGWDTVHKWGGYRAAIARRIQVVDNFGNGFWVDGDNRGVTLRDSFVARNKGLQGVYMEKNQGPITVVGNRICDNASAGVADAQSDHVILKGNEIFGNRQFNIMFTGNYAGQQVYDHVTGQAVTVRSRGWIVEGNTVVGSGTAGWLWWHTDYQAPGAWTQTRNSMMLINNNTWYHSGRADAFRLPQGSLNHGAFRADFQVANPQHEVHSTWGPKQLSCTYVPRNSW